MKRMKQDMPKGTEKDFSLHEVKGGKASREELQEGIKSSILQHASKLSHPFYR